MADKTPAEAAEARKKFVNKLTFSLLDYRHHTLASLEKCVEVLLLICRNVVEKADDEKFRRVRATNKRIVTAFSGHPAAAELLQVSGWHTQVVDCEKCWTFDAEPGSRTFGLLEFAVAQLQKALEELRAKQRASSHNSGVKKAEDAVERDKVLRSIEADRQEREERVARQREAAAVDAVTAELAAVDAADAKVERVCQGRAKIE